MHIIICVDKTFQFCSSGIFHFVHYLVCTDVFTTSFAIALSLPALPPPSPLRYSMTADMHTTTNFSSASESWQNLRTFFGKRFRRPRTGSGLRERFFSALFTGFSRMQGVAGRQLEPDFWLRIYFEPSRAGEQFARVNLGWVNRSKFGLLTGRYRVLPLGYTIIPLSLRSWLRGLPLSWLQRRLVLCAGSRAILSFESAKWVVLFRRCLAIVRWSIILCWKYAEVEQNNIKIHTNLISLLKTSKQRSFGVETAESGQQAHI